MRSALLAVAQLAALAMGAAAAETPVPAPAPDVDAPARPGPRRASVTPPVQGVEGIRRPLRGLRFIRERLLERSLAARYAFEGRMKLLHLTSDVELADLLILVQQYRALVDELLAIPVREYLRDPGTREALVRAIRWGHHTALAVPRIHRLGYLRIQPILDGPMNLEAPPIFGNLDG